MRKLYLIIASLLVAGLAYSAPDTQVNTPNSFSPNTVIQSSKVNDNNNEIQSKYNSHTHTDITQVGTITAGGWAGTAVPTTYGGTGQNFGTVASGSIVYFTGIGTMGILRPAPAGYVLGTKTGSSAPDWVPSGARDVIFRGFEVVVEQPNAVRCLINPGALSHGSTVVETLYVGGTSQGASQAILTLATGSNWSSGSTVTITNNWNYIGISATGQVAYLGILSPNRFNTSTGTGTGSVVNLYSYDGSTYWRVIGAVRENGSSQIQQFRQNKDIIMWNVPVTITTTVSDGAWSGAISVEGAMSRLSRFGIFGCTSRHVGSQNGIWLRPNNSTWSTNIANGIVDTAGNETSGKLLCATDSNYQIQNYNDGGDTTTQVDLESYYLNIR